MVPYEWDSGAESMHYNIHFSIHSWFLQHGTKNVPIKSYVQNVQLKIISKTAKGQTQNNSEERIMAFTQP